MALEETHLRVAGQKRGISRLLDGSGVAGQDADLGIGGQESVVGGDRGHSGGHLLGGGPGDQEGGIEDNGGQDEGRHDRNPVLDITGYTPLGDGQMDGAHSLAHFALLSLSPVRLSSVYRSAVEHP